VRECAYRQKRDNLNTMDVCHNLLSPSVLLLNDVIEKTLTYAHAELTADVTNNDETGSVRLFEGARNDRSKLKSLIIQM
jgi:hypothetical protein